MGFFDFFKNKKEDKATLDSGLEKTRTSFLEKLSRAVTGKSKIDDEVLENLEELLLAADVGMETTQYLIQNIEKRASKDKYMDAAELNTILKEEIYSIFKEKESIEDGMSSVQGTYVILVVGVNGVGKTTTIGKLSNKFKSAGKTVILGAADTFRAAAVEQLGVWAQRTQSAIVKQHTGADPAAVAYDTVQSAVAKNMDVAIIDTAGRLHNKVGLMNELEKIHRVIQKVNAGYPNEVLLVLDGSTGQNAIEQAKHFGAATKVSGIALTKLDGTAKGGVVMAIAHQFNIPVRYIGVGEKIEDLQVFNAKDFVDSLFGNVDLVK